MLSMRLTKYIHMMIELMGLSESSRTVSTPGENNAKCYDTCELSAEQATLYRAIVAI